MNTNDFYTSVQNDKRETAAYDPYKIDFFLKEIGRKKTVLEIGCNDGYIGEKILKNGNIVHGLDFVSDNLKIARKRGIKVTNLNIEEKEFPFPNNYFDIVILGDVLEHVFDTDSLLQKCNRVLKKNGTLLIATPNVASLGRRIMLLLGINPFLEFSLKLTIHGGQPVGHIRYYTIKTLTEQLIHNKFAIKKIKGDVLSFVFFRFNWGGNLFPTLAPMILCSAVKT